MSINSEVHNQIGDDNYDAIRIQTAILHFIEAVLEQPDPFERAMLLNELREYLNRVCVLGYFGSPHAHACQRIVNIVHHFSGTDDNNMTAVDDTTSSNEDHDMKKRFFCNGFIGCKNAGR